MTDLRTRWPRWLAGYALLVGAGTWALGAKVERFDVLQSFLAANLLLFSVAPIAMAVVVGRIKYRTPRARRCFYAALAVPAGAVLYVYGDLWYSAGSVTGVLPKTLNGLLLAIFVLATATAAMVAEMAVEVRRANRLQVMEVQAELKLLQAQIEPHFLFNTLANLRHLVQTGSPEALAMLDHLVHYLRTALPDIRTPGSTVARELELARAYLEIMRIRMGGALEFAIEMPSEVADAELPSLMLMTLVENAVKHGIAPRGGGRIAIRALRDAKGVRVEVDDDGPGLTRPAGRGVGLANVRERLRAVYGERARLDLEQREPAGLRAVIEIAR
jgi:LytS/YehU family sensor histidine kinase